MAAARGELGLRSVRCDRRTRRKTSAQGRVARAGALGKTTPASAKRHAARGGPLLEPE